MTNPPRLLSLATAVPKHVLSQDNVAETARHIFGRAGVADLDRMVAVFGNAGIDCRYSTVPVEWYERRHGWTDRNTLYLDHALALFEEAAHKALAEAGLRPVDIDAVVAVSTTGIATPSLDAMLLNRIGLRSDVQRLPIFGLGLRRRRARPVARRRFGPRQSAIAYPLPGRRALHAVLPSRRFRQKQSRRHRPFGDGAAAAVIRATPPKASRIGPALQQSGEFTWPDSLDIMGWDVAEDGLKAIFSRDIPTLVHRDLRARPTISSPPRPRARTISATFVCHPGGAKVLDALEEAFSLAPGALGLARATLRDYGNMSAATVLFVLDARCSGRDQRPDADDRARPRFHRGLPTDRRLNRCCSVTWATLIVGLVALERLAELVFARRHTSALLRDGGVRDRPRPLSADRRATHRLADRGLCHVAR